VTSWERIATGGATVALQPVWTSAERLVFTDDISGRWNLQQFTLGDPAPSPIAPAEADTGGGLWVLGLKWFGVLDDGRIVACRTHGSDEIVLLDADGEVTSLGIDAIAYTVIEDVSGTQALISTTGADGTAAIWRIDVDRPGVAQRVAGGESPWEDEWMPRARPVTFDGPRGPVHAFDFPPTSPAFSGPDEELPPYVVFVHGGPTTHVGGAASGKIAHLTSRGIGVLDVNYGGSTGYGRAYRERLRGEWGVVDVEDVVAAARYLAEERLADPRRVAIAGGSAGGWTVLCALARSDAFAAGISRYGVADLRLLAADTGDFESRYLDSMVGPLPESEQLYIERSPLSHLAGLTTPMLIEQGLDDAVVPPSQSEAVRDALAANGVPHAYLAFAGEGHGFRRAETIITTLDAELSFLGQVFGFTPPGVPDLILA
jgi:dipeptidyl aminopeptidase/acylaminoacyl peptidase